MENKHCYNFLPYETKKAGVLDGCVDATYIIHLIDNGRKENILKQLKRVIPTKTIYIIENPGFKKCKKMLKEQKSQFDLVDAFLNAFYHAKENDYNNILILEDDFIWNDKLNDEKVGNSICNFINEKNDTNFIYALGCMPLIKINMGNEHQRCLFPATSHAIIYGKKFREKMLVSKERSSISPIFELFTHWDYQIYHTEKTNYFCYRSPLCYQIFPQTENQRNWPALGGITFILIGIIRLIKLDKQHSPGFEIMYVIGDVTFYTLLLIVIYFIYRLTKFISKRKIFKNKILKTS